MGRWPSLLCQCLERASGDHVLPAHDREDNRHAHPTNKFVPMSDVWAGFVIDYHLLQATSPGQTLCTVNKHLFSIKA